MSSPSIRRSTRPHSKPSFAPIGLPVAHISRAFFDPRHARQALGAAGAGQKAELTSGVPSFADGIGDAIMAGQGHLEPAAERRAVDRSDDWLGTGFDAVDDLREHRLLERLGGTELGDVGAREEGLPFTRDDQRFDAVVAFRLLDCRDEALPDRRAEGVHRRIVRKDDQHVAVLACGNRAGRRLFENVVAHEYPPGPGARPLLTALQVGQRNGRSRVTLSWPTARGSVPTFFLSGFECSTFLWGKDRRRRDLNAELRHYQHADEDYALLPPIGIAVAREGIPWPLIDRGAGEYDFSLIDPFLAAQRRHNVLPIWDLCHYGYPDGLDPFSNPDSFVLRFAAYARAAARYVAERAHHGPLCIGPINEPTFWGYMGGEWALVRSIREFARGPAAVHLASGPGRYRGMQGDPPGLSRARFVHIDPLIWVVPPRDRPDLADEAHRERMRMRTLPGTSSPGSSTPKMAAVCELIDILGLNNYSSGRWNMRAAASPTSR